MDRPEDRHVRFSARNFRLLRESDEEEPSERKRGFPGRGRRGGFWRRRRFSPRDDRGELKR
ncbi:hypothetical protein OESDEN_20765 [Oesophagostomum dentatum]|uniref:Uncharacterized protein n=1 Tax=Oesophagostomum dentatum TaxID=61180 RepID=A0A0B1S2K3_OESDE|nr:hypothetical protein OESDEN_20765 [Oesophagostomum dentatum]